MHIGISSRAVVECRGLFASLQRSSETVELGKQVGCLFALQNLVPSPCSADRIDPLATLATRQPLALRVLPDFGSLTKKTLESNHRISENKDILYVMRVLGHKSIQNTLVYTQMVQFKKEEYASATANTIEDAQKLVEEGFEYVTEIDGVKLFRKRK
jgi:hypothetical protein